MYLTKTEEKLLDGEYGKGLSLCMKYLVKYGEAVDADRLASNIRYAHISGVSPHTIGEPGIRFRRHLSNLGLRVSTDTSLNPCSMKMDERQLEILRIYERLGVDLTLTCSPEKIRNYKGELIICAESSLSCFANSVLNARTNR